MLAGPEIRTELLRDVYITLLDLDEQDGLATIRVATTPLVGWIWISTALMAVGAGIAGWPRRGGPRVRGGRAPRATAGKEVRAGRPGRETPSVVTGQDGAAEPVDEEVRT